MSLTRQTQKVFGSNADANQIAAFGTMKTGTPVYSTNLSTLQTQEYTEGWAEAILNDKAPFLEEMNAVQYGLSYQIAYLLQEGIPEYDANTEYSNTSIVKVIDNDKILFYLSLSNNNTNNPLTDTTNWKSLDYATTAELNTKADVDGSNMDASVKNFDGQWVNKYVQLSTATSANTYSIDLSSHLPSDNYSYEILVGGGIYTDGANRAQELKSSIITGSWVRINKTKDYSDEDASVCVFPVGADRTLSYRITGSGGSVTMELNLYAYRRIGTNA